jgi:IS30 family transposase
VYDPVYAQQRAYVKRKDAKYQGMKVVENANLRTFVDSGLKEGRSPESIAGRLKYQEKTRTYVSKEGIKTYLKSVYGRQIESLRKKLFPTKKPRNKSGSKGTLDGRKFIDKRPQIATLRQRVGDVEADFILSGKHGRGILLTVADRKTRVSFIEQILVPTIKNMERTFLKIKKRFPEMKTITTDNDLLFQHHRKLEKILNVNIYFCNPYHSWEKGTIERTNKEIRKYIPKGSNISFYTPSFVKKVETTINDRWMKILKFASPAELVQKFRELKRRRTGV